MGKQINEYVWFEKVALIFIPLAFVNVLFGDFQLGITGGLLWTAIWLWIRKRNLKARNQKFAPNE
jgi:hypothetical protein